MVQQFHGRRDDAGRDDAAYRHRGVPDRVENGADGAGVFRIGCESNPGFGNYAEGSLAADQQAGQVEFGGIANRAELYDRAIARDGLDTEDMVNGHAILQRMRPAGVGRHVSADGANALAGRIWGEVIAAAGQFPWSDAD